MKRLVLPAPPEFAETLGYRGEARYVAFWWTPSGDELCFYDGSMFAAGASWHAWLTFIRHPLVRACLDVAAEEDGVGRYEFGSSDSEAVHALLLDRWQQTLDVGPVSEAELFLRTQPSPAAAVQQAYDLSDEEMLTHMLEVFKAQQNRPSDEIIREAHERLEQDRRLEQAMAAWLDQVQEQTTDSGS